MKKIRNELGQFSKENFDIIIKIPGPSKIIRAILITFILLPWLFIIFCRLNIFAFIKDLMEKAFSIPNTNENGNDSNKKSSSFF